MSLGYAHTYTGDYQLTYKEIQGGAIMRTLALAVLALFLLPLNAAADEMMGEHSHKDKAQTEDYERGRMGEDAALELKDSELLTRVTEAYKQLMKKQSNAAKEIHESANCIAVFPNVIKAALIVGGRKGDGVAVCKTADNEWSQVAFLDLFGGSLGAQIGATSTDVAMFFTTEKAQQKLQNGSFTLGADLEAALGTNAAEISTQITKNDIVVLSSTAGAFAGAALNGTQVQFDKSRNAQFHKSETTAEQVLTTAGDMKDPAAKQLISAIKGTQM